jgi:hypothetical protein
MDRCSNSQPGLCIPTPCSTLNRWVEMTLERFVCRRKAGEERCWLGVPIREGAAMCRSRDKLGRCVSTMRRRQVAPIRTWHSPLIRSQSIITPSLSGPSRPCLPPAASHDDPTKRLLQRGGGPRSPRLIFRTAREPARARSTHRSDKMNRGFVQAAIGMSRESERGGTAKRVSSAPQSYQPG